MKVIHIESGLGNQMLSYCEYLAIKKMNPNEEVYLETIIYDIPECEDYICQWNGFELARVFGINAPNIREKFSDEVWDAIIRDIKDTRFWEKNWNYPVYFTKTFKKYGLDLENFRGDFEQPGYPLINVQANTFRSRLGKTYLGYRLKCLNKLINKSKILEACNQQSNVFLTTSRNIFSGQRLCMKNRNNGIERIAAEIEEAFAFPPITDENNLKLLDIIRSSNAVAIHARRGDMLGWNGVYYKYGYFKKAVKYIKKHVNNPVFVFFCDPGSVEWCKNNAHIFGLDFKSDTVLFADWNKAENSYRDMQLMAECKHAIITNSSFGWWGAYFIRNENKITISPEIQINTSMHFS